MKRLFLSMGAMASSVGAALAAMPSVSNVRVEQGTHKVKVRYTLSGAPAVVTVDFQTNSAAGGWVSLGAERFHSLSGDVNRRVEAGSRVLTWQSVADGATFRTDADGFRAVVKVFDVTQPPDWMVVKLDVGTVCYYDCKAALPGGFDNDIYKTTHLLLRKIPAAGMSFLMGGCSFESERDPAHAAAESRHKVIFTKDFYLAVYETTYKQAFDVKNLSGCPENLAKFPIAASGWTNWNSLRGASSGWPQGGHACEAGIFFDKLQKKTGQVFDLPTDAQWEFACRAGSTGVLNSGLDCEMVTSGSAPNIEELAWCATNSEGEKHEVGLKAPNAWDLYDMHGNVLELCLDSYSEDLGTATVVDPVGPTTENNNRVVRGGSFQYSTTNLRSARRTYTGRTYADGAYGFRIWCEAVAR